MNEANMIDFKIRHRGRIQQIGIISSSFFVCSYMKVTGKYFRCLHLLPG